MRAWWMRVRRAWDRMAVYLPLFLMSIMAMGTYWLVRNTPVIAPAEEAAPKRHVPDYFMKDFSVKVFNAEGKLKSEIFGVQGRHYPDTDTVEVDQPRIRSLNPQGQITVAVAQRGLINADGSEAQLFEKAEIVRERSILRKLVSVSDEIAISSLTDTSLRKIERSRTISAFSNSCASEPSALIKPRCATATVICPCGLRERMRGWSTSTVSVSG